MARHRPEDLEPRASSLEPETPPRCFGRIAEDDRIELEPDEAHHLVRVLRIERGAWVEVVDAGRVVLAEVVAAGRRDLELRLVRELEPRSSGAVPIRLAAAVLHPPAMERLVRLAAELHVARVSPVLTERTQHRNVPAKLLERWRRIAREACKQARRSDLPFVDEPVELRHFLAEEVPPGILRLCLTPRDADLEVSGLAALPAPGGIWLLQGPEGGWSPAELCAAGASGFRAWSLGRAVFRAETCPLIAVTLLHEHHGQLFQK
jgi:16S rRNA (uracil1498-N3)-methyltransferase